VELVSAAPEPLGDPADADAEGEVSDTPTELVPDGGAEEEGPAPVPPASVESCAKPMEGGFERKTEYTFFYSF
jgi:hypothetical protein